MKNLILCNYDERNFAKSRNGFFGSILSENIKSVISGAKIVYSKNWMIISADNENTREILRKIPGINYFLFIKAIISQMDDIKSLFFNILSEEGFNTVKIYIKIYKKDFEFSEKELEKILREEVIGKTKKKINDVNPDKKIFIRIGEKRTYFYFKKIKGTEGIPVGSYGKAVSLISGGIDSPVASFKMMKRGIRNIFVHFESYPLTKKESIEKVEMLVEKLSVFQGESVLYLVPFYKIQMTIALNTAGRQRVFLYSRFWMRIAEKIAKKENAIAVITGMSLGQVTQQSVKGIEAYESVLNSPILRPLIAHDRKEIIEVAKEIGTYKISTISIEDCCTRLLTGDLDREANEDILKEEEKKLNVKEMVENAVENSERKIINYYK